MTGGWTEMGETIHLSRFPLILALCVILSGCNLVPYYYRGDGNFDNRWMEAAHSRYLLTLGQFNSSQPAKATFQIGKLPAKVLKQRRFAFGLRPDGNDLDGLFPEEHRSIPGRKDTDSRLQNMARVHLKLVDTHTGEVMGEIDESLSEWNWSMSFAGENEIQEVWIGSIHLTPIRGHTYALSIEISEPDQYGIPLILEGGGGDEAIFSFF
jgi:hypothetical protein